MGNVQGALECVREYLSGWSRQRWKATVNLEASLIRYPILFQWILVNDRMVNNITSLKALFYNITMDVSQMFSRR